jgi:hypothetical protein
MPAVKGSATTPFGPIAFKSNMQFVFKFSENVLLERKSKDENEKD